jgi:hypothetical protein
MMRNNTSMFLLVLSSSRTSQKSERETTNEVSIYSRFCRGGIKNNRKSGNPSSLSLTLSYYFRRHTAQTAQTAQTTQTAQTGK